MKRDETLAQKGFEVLKKELGLAKAIQCVAELKESQTDYVLHNPTGLDNMSLSEILKLLDSNLTLLHFTFPLSFVSLRGAQRRSNPSNSIDCFAALAMTL
jgi:hypothetical protein